MKKDTKTFIATVGSIVGVLSFATMTSAYFKPVEYIREGLSEGEEVYELLETETATEQALEVSNETTEFIPEPTPEPIETPVVVDEGLSQAEAERIRKQVADLQAALIAKQQAEAQANAVVVTPDPTPPKKVSKPKPSRQTHAS